MEDSCLKKPVSWISSVTSLYSPIAAIGYYIYFQGLQNGGGFQNTLQTVSSFTNTENWSQALPGLALIGFTMGAKDARYVHRSKKSRQIYTSA